MTTTDPQPTKDRVNPSPVTPSEASSNPALAGEQAESSMSIETSADEWSPATSADQHRHDAVGAVTPTTAASGAELQLNDLDFVDGKQPPVTASEPLSLPAALVDDGLLEEINAIPDKMGFKIGDVAELLGVKQYVLRYWESEFEVLRPKKASNNQRMYTRKDVENAFLIRKLLYRDRFSIEGARQVLRELKQQVRKEKDISQVVQKLGSASERLQELASHVRRLRQSIR